MQTHAYHVLPTSTPRRWTSRLIELRFHATLDERQFATREKAVKKFRQQLRRYLDEALVEWGGTRHVGDPLAPGLQNVRVASVRTLDRVRWSVRLSFDAPRYATLSELDEYITRAVGVWGGQFDWINTPFDGGVRNASVYFVPEEGR